MTEGVAEARKKDQRGVLLLRAGMIALMLGMFVWVAGDGLLEASLFLAVAAAYAVLVYRVVSQSVRAFTVMFGTFFLNYVTLISITVDDDLGIPAAGPWFVGFVVGGIAGAYVWFGPGAGTEFKQARKRSPEADGSFTGGWRLAVVNAVCVLVLLGMGVAQLVLLSPSVLAVAVLAVAVIAGWALFRFPPPLPVRDGLLLAIPVPWFALMFIGGATDQMGLPSAWAYGVLAGILIGGRYWSGPRFGAPRPPFSGHSTRRRRRKRRPRPTQTEDPTDHVRTPVNRP